MQPKHSSIFPSTGLSSEAIWKAATPLSKAPVGLRQTMALHVPHDNGSHPCARSSSASAGSATNGPLLVMLHWTLRSGIVFEATSSLVAALRGRLTLARGCSSPSFADPFAVSGLTTELSRRAMLDSDANEVSEHVERASRRLQRFVRWMRLRTIHALFCSALIASDSVWGNCLGIGFIRAWSNFSKSSSRPGILNFAMYLRAEAASR